MKAKVMGKNGLKVVDLNRRRAIRERCLNCSGWFPKDVTECNLSDCPLSPFRTGEGKQNPKQRKTAIRKYCLWCMAGQHSEVGKCTSILCPLFAYRLTFVDRTTEIPSKAKFPHIEPVFETNTGQCMSEDRERA